MASRMPGERLCRAPAPTALRLAHLQLGREAPETPPRPTDVLCAGHPRGEERRAEEPPLPPGAVPVWQQSTEIRPERC